MLALVASVKCVLEICLWFIFGQHSLWCNSRCVIYIKIIFDNSEWCISHTVDILYWYTWLRWQTIHPKHGCYVFFAIFSKAQFSYDFGKPLHSVQWYRYISCSDCDVCYAVYRHSKICIFNYDYLTFHSHELTYKCVYVIYVKYCVICVKLFQRHVFRNSCGHWKYYLVTISNMLTPMELHMNNRNICGY